MNVGQDDGVRVYKASKILQSKVGTGSVAKERVEACQWKLDNNTTDFEPMARKFLQQLADAVKAFKGDGDVETLRQRVTNPVMQLKANAPMFGYPLVGDLSNIMLSFLESVTSIDKDMVTIVDAQQKTLTVIINTRMKGDGGEMGKTMKTELMTVCKKYLERKSRKAG